MFEFTKSWDSCTTDAGVPTLGCIYIALHNLINVAIALSGVVALFFIIWAGFKFITSQGDAEQVSNARQTFFYAIIGLVFVILSFAIFNFVLQDFLGLNSEEFRSYPE